MIPPIASNFVAGETPDRALAHVGEINARGVGGILNLLGEHYDERPPADADAAAYMDLVDAIGDGGHDCSVSVKPSQIGLDLGDEVFEENLAAIVDRAADNDVFVWVDMEDYTTTDVTLDAVERHKREYGKVGVCVQANLKRSREDLERLADLPGKVRLVKGAYDEPKSVAYKKKERVNEAYEEYLEYMFQTFDDGAIAVGSHDPRMISKAQELYEEYGTDYEVQMLMGVREDAQFDLADEVPVYQYIPYGDKWMSYFYRRVRERKENALFALRAVVGV